ncbi:MAG: dehydrogenase [Clostridia bacterium]|jgi:formate hydrogenlyase subunit 3/multisubunit Na+/H+ antiporter MnhD subunit|nr:dehydrogenase [Clostridia bacterium]
MLAQFLLLFILVFPMICALAGWIIGRKHEQIRNIFDVSVSVVEFSAVCLLSIYLKAGPIQVIIPDIMGEGLYLKLDYLRYIFVFLTAFVWLLTTYYSTQYLTKFKNRNRYFAFFTLTLSSTVGIFISQDLLNLFTFFELMSFSSYILVIHDEDQYSHKAGASYIAAAIIGGLFLLMGLFLLYDYAGTLNIDLLPGKIEQMGAIRYVIAALMLVGFGVKAGMVPLHVWLPQAYAAAPSSASAVLSGILSKTGVFGILIVATVIMKGDLYISLALLLLGLMTMLTGGLLAVFQKHLKRILAFSSMSQIGYIIAGIGLIGLLEEHGEIAIYGTILHIVNHSLFKVMLFLCAGVINRTMHEQNINLLRGFGRNKHLLKITFFIGLLGITGVPGFIGFASKSLLHEALVEAQHLFHSRLLWGAEILFIFCSALTVVYMLKIFITLFVEKNSAYKDEHKKYMNIRELIPPMILSLCVLLMSLMTGPVLRYISKALTYLTGHVSTFEIKIYTAQNIYSAMMILAIGIVAFVWGLRRFYRKQVEGNWVYFNPIPDGLNLEAVLYIPLGKFLYKTGFAVFSIIDAAIMMPAEWIAAGAKYIGEIKIKRSNRNYLAEFLQRYYKEKTASTPKLPPKEKPASDKVVEESLKGIFEGLRYRFNSIIYGIFIFAIALVLILFVLVSNQVGT